MARQDDREFAAQENKSLPGNPAVRRQLHLLVPLPLGALVRLVEAPPTQTSSLGWRPNCAFARFSLVFFVWYLSSTHSKARSLSRTPLSLRRLSLSFSRRLSRLFLSHIGHTGFVLDQGKQERRQKQRAAETTPCCPTR